MQRMSRRVWCGCFAPPANATLTTHPRQLTFKAQEGIQQEEVETGSISVATGIPTGPQPLLGPMQGPVPASEHPAVSAWRQGALGFAFSGGGFLLPYYAGVVHQLLHMGVIQPGVTHLSGSSAGSLIAACVNGGVSTSKVLAAVLAVASNCRTHGVPGRLAGVLSAQLHEHLPHDAHVRCSGRSHVGITLLWPRPKSMVVSDFTSREELVAALMASCHLPFLSDGSITTQFRGRTVLDGGVTALIPLPPATSQCTHVVKVACLPRAHIPHLPLMNKKAALKGLALAPDMFGTWPHDVHDTLQLALRPGSHSFLTDLVDRGSRDALSWATDIGLASQLTTAQAQLAVALVAEVPESDPLLAAKAGEHVTLDPPSKQPTHTAVVNPPPKQPTHTAVVNPPLKQRMQHTAEVVNSPPKQPKQQKAEVVNPPPKQAKLTAALGAGTQRPAHPAGLATADPSAQQPGSGADSPASPLVGAGAESPRSPHSPAITTAPQQTAGQLQAERLPA